MQTEGNLSYWSELPDKLGFAYLLQKKQTECIVVSATLETLFLTQAYPYPLPSH
jgi:hypothetical protein